MIHYRSESFQFSGVCVSTSVGVMIFTFIDAEVGYRRGETTLYRNSISKLDVKTFFVSFFLISEILEDFGFFSTIFSQISVFLLPNSEINKMISLPSLVYIGHSNSDWNSIYAVRREIFSKYLISLP